MLSAALVLCWPLDEEDDDWLTALRESGQKLEPLPRNGIHPCGKRHTNSSLDPNKYIKQTGCLCGKGCHTACRSLVWSSEILCTQTLQTALGRLGRSKRMFLGPTRDPRPLERTCSPLQSPGTERHASAFWKWWNMEHVEYGGHETPIWYLEFLTQNVSLKRRTSTFFYRVMFHVLRYELEVASRPISMNEHVDY